jgi:hypothetical protein
MGGGCCDQEGESVETMGLDERIGMKTVMGDAEEVE